MTTRRNGNPPPQPGGPEQDPFTRSIQGFPTVFVPQGSPPSSPSPPVIRDATGLPTDPQSERETRLKRYLGRGRKALLKIGRPEVEIGRLLYRFSGAYGIERWLHPDPEHRRRIADELDSRAAEMMQGNWFDAVFFGTPFGAVPRSTLPPLRALIGALGRSRQVSQAIQVAKPVTPEPVWKAAGREIGEPMTPVAAGAQLPPGGRPPAGGAGGYEAAKQRMFGEGPQGKPILPGVQDWYLRQQERFVDKFARINRDTGIVRREWERRVGEKLPTALEAELHAAAFPGMPARGISVSSQTLKRVRQLLKEDIDPDDLNFALRVRHEQDIHKMHPERKISGDLEPQQLQPLLDELLAKLGTAKATRLAQAADEVKGFYQSYLDQKAAEGLLTREVASHLQETYPWYNPIVYLEKELTNIASSGVGKAFSVTQNDIRKLSEYGSELATERPLDLLSRYAVNSEILMARNRTARAIIQMELLNPAVASQMRRVTPQAPFGKMKGRDTLSYMDNGQPVTYELPEEIANAARQLQLLGSIEFWEGTGRWLNSIPRAFLTSMNPLFAVSNFLHDSFIMGVTRGLLPQRTAISLLKNLRAIVADDPAMETYMRSGAAIGGFAAKAPERLIHQVNRSGNFALSNTTEWAYLLRHPLETLERLGSAVELAPRRALFERELKRGADELHAAVAARRGTIDFQRMGSAMRFANAWYLYLNAGVQGGLLPLRALRDSPAARYGLMGYLGITGAAYWWNRQFPEWRDLSTTEKYTRFGVMLPSKEVDKQGNTVPHFLAPLVLREFGLFSAPMIHILSRLEEKDTESAAEFLRALGSALNPVSSIISTSGAPVPSYLGQAITEIALNRDFYFNREIVPIDLQGKPREEQYDKFSSETSRRLGKFLNISPKHIDHLIKTGLGWELVTMGDVVLSKVFGEDEDPHIASLVEQLKEIPERVPADFVKRERRNFLNALTADEREKVIEGERRPEPRIPFWDGLQLRFLRKLGGQLYRSGLQKAAGEFEVSVEQTQKLGRILNETFRQLTDEQQKWDEALSEQQMTPTRWLELRKISGAAVRLALVQASVQFPRAAQLLNADDRKSFYDMVYTMNGEILDRRTRAALLYAAWVSIAPTETYPGVYDWDAFYEERDAFLAHLTDSDREELKQERFSRMSRMEQEYEQHLILLRPYYDVRRQYLRMRPSARIIWERLESAERRGLTNQAKFLKARPEIKTMEQYVRDRTRMMRQMNPTLDGLLRLWEKVDTTMTPQAEAYYQSTLRAR